MTTRKTPEGIEVSEIINGLRIKRHYVGHTTKEALNLFIKFVGSQDKKKFIVFQNGKRIGFVFSTDLSAAYNLVKQRRTGEIVVFNESLTEHKDK
jgi:hypothetical protein